MFADCSVPSRIVELEDPEIAGQADQLPAFESESQYGVRVQPRQRAGKALRIVMATWNVEQELRTWKFVHSYRSRVGLKQATISTLV